MGADARSYAQTHLDIDQAAVWKRILDDQYHSLPPMVLTNAQATMLDTIRRHVGMMCQSQTAPVPGSGVYQTAFVPLPEKGPAKALRKKTATFMQVLLIEGPKGVARVMKEKKQARKAAREQAAPAGVAWKGRAPAEIEPEQEGDSAE